MNGVEWSTPSWKILTIPFFCHRKIRPSGANRSPTAWKLRQGGDGLHRKAGVIEGLGLTARRENQGDQNYQDESQVSSSKRNSLDEFVMSQ